MSPGDTSSLTRRTRLPSVVSLLRNMNAKLLLKTLFLIVMLLLLVLIGLKNPGKVTLVLPYLPPTQQPAAIMYFAFFAVGVLTGTVLSVGGGKRGSGSKSAKSEH